jgi:hypothetical protein
MTTNLALDVSSSRVVLDGGNWAGLNHANNQALNNHCNHTPKTRFAIVLKSVKFALIYGIRQDCFENPLKFWSRRAE